MQNGNTMTAGMNGGAGQPKSVWKMPALVTALLLVIPILGNRFVDGWNWALPGFFLFGAMVFGAALAYARLTRNVPSIAYRAALALAFTATLVLLWMNRVQAADDVNPHALIYFVVPVIGLITLAFTHVDAGGMGRALFVTSIAQAGVLAMTLLLWNPNISSWTLNVWRAIGLNGFVLILFVASALLFRSAARTSSASGAR